MVRLVDLGAEAFETKKEITECKDWKRDGIDTRTLARPTIEKECTTEGCGNDQAYFYSRQIRSVDEGQTVYYECTECGITTTEDT